MIPWSTVNPALRAWFLTGTGLDLVVMTNEPRPFTEMTWGHLQVMSVGGAGMDVRTLVDVPVGDPPVNHTRQQIEGQRTFVLRCSVESLSQDDTDFADNPLEQLRSTWELDAQTSALLAVNVALADFGPSQMVDYEVDDHQISAWVADLTFNAAFTYTDGTDVDTIETVTQTSAFVEADGVTPLPDSLQEAS